MRDRSKAMVAGIVAALMVLTAVLFVLPTTEVTADSQTNPYIKGNIYWGDTGNKINYSITVDLWNPYTQSSALTTPTVTSIGHYNITVAPGIYVLKTYATRHAVDEDFIEGDVVFFATESEPFILDEANITHINVDYAKISSHIDIDVVDADTFAPLDAVDATLYDEANDYTIGYKSASGGMYSFDVYDGTFELVCKKTGYADSTSSPFTVTLGGSDVTGYMNGTTGGPHQITSTTVKRVRDGLTTTLVNGTDYTYNPTTGLTTFLTPLENRDRVYSTYVNNTRVEDEVIKVVEVTDVANETMIHSDAYTKLDEVVINGAIDKQTKGYLDNAPVVPGTVNVYHDETELNETEVIAQSMDYFQFDNNRILSIQEMWYTIGTDTIWLCHNYPTNVTFNKKYVKSLDSLNGKLYFVDTFSLVPGSLVDASYTYARDMSDIASVYLNAHYEAATSADIYPTDNTGDTTNENLANITGTANTYNVDPTEKLSLAGFTNVAGSLLTGAVLHITYNTTVTYAANDDVTLKNQTTPVDTFTLYGNTTLNETTYDLFANGFNSWTDITNLLVEFTNSDGTGVVYFDQMWVEASYSFSPQTIHYKDGETGPEYGSDMLPGTTGFATQSFAIPGITTWDQVYDLNVWLTNSLGGVSYNFDRVWLTITYPWSGTSEVNVGTMHATLNTTADWLLSDILAIDGLTYDVANTETMWVGSFLTTGMPYELNVTAGKITFNPALEEGTIITANYTCYPATVYLREFDTTTERSGRDVTGSVEIYNHAAGALVSQADYAIDDANGLVSFTTALPAEYNLTANYSWYNPNIDTTNTLAHQNVNNYVVEKNLVPVVEDMDYTINNISWKVEFNYTLAAGDNITISYNYPQTFSNVEMIASAYGQTWSNFFPAENYTMTRLTSVYINGTVKGIPYGTKVWFMLYDGDTGKTTTSYQTVNNDIDYQYELTANQGDFTLVVYPEGYAPNTVELGPLSGTGVVVPAQYETFTKLTTVEERTNRIEFKNAASGDFNDITLSSNWTLNPNSHLSELSDDNLRNVRFQIDTVLGNGDGQLDWSEKLAFEDWMVQRTVKHLYTDGFFEVNDTAYKLDIQGTADITDEYHVELIVPGLTSIQSVDVDGASQIFINTYINYTTVEHVNASGSEYTLYIKPGTGEGEYTIALPPGYERDDHPETNEIVDDHIEITIGVTVGVELSIKKSVLPNPSATMITGQYVKEVTIDNETEYLVKSEENATFDATASSVDVGSIKQIQWNFGDGLVTDWINWTSSAYRYVHMYNDTVDTSYDVVLTVRGTSGQENTTTIRVHVDAEEPTPDIAYTTLTIGQGGNITFNASDSHDGWAFVEPEDLTYEWNFGDDSDDEVSLEIEQEHVFVKPGQYTVVLNVTDQLGHYKNASVAVTVQDTVDPIPKVTVDNRNPTEGQTVEFNASTSYDPENEDADDMGIVSYSWRFPGNVTKTGKVVNHTFEDVGTFTVNLTVTDGAGNTNSLNYTIDVTVGARPDLWLESISISGKKEEGSKVTIEMHFKNIGDGNMTDDALVTLYIDDKEIDTEMITAIEIDGNATVTFTHKFSKAGNFTIRGNVSTDEEWYTTLYNNEMDTKVTIKEAAWKSYAAIVGALAIIVVIVVLVAKREAIGDMMRAKQEKKLEEKKERRKEEKKDKKKDEKKDEKKDDKKNKK